MTPKEALAVLAATFLPNKDLPHPTVEIYVAKMGEINPPLLTETIHSLIERARFFPSIAEIRQTAASLAGVLPIGADEAVAIVNQADVTRPVYRRDGTHAYDEQEWQWPEGLTWRSLGTIRAALARVGESRDDSGRRRFGWEQGFKSAYEAEVHDVVMNLNLRHAAKALPNAPKPAALPEPSAVRTTIAKQALAIVQDVVDKKISEAEAHERLNELLEGQQDDAA